MIKVLGIWGKDKTCKTTLALTAPKPLLHMEFDMGGFDRASHRFQKDIDGGLIVNRKYYMLPDFPNLVDVKGKVSFRPQKLVGYKELWVRFLKDFQLALMDKTVVGENVVAFKTIVVDTATVLEELDTKKILQTKQENQLDANGNMRDPTAQLRESLAQTEYGERNDDHRALINYAVSMGKVLVLVHHASDEYMKVAGQKEGTPTGRKILDGWKKLPDMADVIVRTYTEMRTTGFTPCCEVEVCGLAPQLTGAKIDEPSYDGLVKRIRLFRGG